MTTLLLLLVLFNERTESARLAPKYDAVTEVTSWDGTRADLVNSEYAIEVEWAEKWKESIGQSIYYSIVHNKKPGIILLRKKGLDVSHHIYRCQTVCAKVGITLWIEDVE